jgi:hypothetical protein
MKKLRGVFLFLLFLLLLLITEVIVAQNQIPVSVISSGGEKSSSASFILSSTVGEQFIGKSVNSASQHNIGFWYVYKQSTLTDVEKENETIPTVFKLEQNYPNPFNPSTIIKFAVPERRSVLIKIYDILGGEVITIVNEEMDSGWYKREFNASGYSTGVYIYRMQAGNYVSTKKMILIK